MLRLVESKDERHSYLASSEGEREIRAFLKAQGLRAYRGSFGYIRPPAGCRLSCYRLEGDEHLQIRALKIPRITFSQLALYVLQVMPATGTCFTRPRYGALPRPELA
jgi:hypothetical protein